MEDPMKTLIKMNLSYQHSTIGQIEKIYDVPMFSDFEGLEIEVKLTGDIALKQHVHATSMNVDTKIITVESTRRVDLTDKCLPWELHDFLKELESEGWAVNANQIGIEQALGLRKSETEAVDVVTKNTFKSTLIKFLYYFSFVLILSSVLVLFSHEIAGKSLEEYISPLVVVGMIISLLVCAFSGYFISKWASGKNN